jgi:spore coat protein U-like protein
MQTTSKLLTAVAALTLVSVSLQAQNNASITVSANVQQPITVTAANNLDFGQVFPGVSKTIAVNQPGAGRFDVTGQASTPVSLTFVLPANLTAGANLLPIGSWNGVHSPTASPTGTSFTPSASATNATLSGTGQLFVYVGAQVTPAVGQVAGNYTGTVQMTVVY